MKKGRNKRRSGAIKNVRELRRHSPYRFLDKKIKESDNRHKLMENMDAETAAFARREFAKLGLF